MRGGIQVGTTAYDGLSRELNSQLTEAKHSLAAELLALGYTMRPRLLPNDIKGAMEGMNPDGGIWYDKEGRLVAVFEAKKQGSKGNAHERWYKNHAIINHISPNARYVTFCCGSGVLVESTMYKCFAFALVREGKCPHSWNVLHPTGTSFFGSQMGFATAQIRAIMLSAITGDGI